MFSSENNQLSFPSSSHYSMSFTTWMLRLSFCHFTPCLLSTLQQLQSGLPKSLSSPSIQTWGRLDFHCPVSSRFIFCDDAEDCQVVPTKHAAAGVLRTQPEAPSPRSPRRQGERPHSACRTKGQEAKAPPSALLRDRHQSVIPVASGFRDQPGK